MFSLSHAMLVQTVEAKENKATVILLNLDSIAPVPGVIHFPDIMNCGVAYMTR